MVSWAVSLSGLMDQYGQSVGSPVGLGRRPELGLELRFCPP